MKLVEWVASRESKTKPQREVLQELAYASDVSIVSVRQYARGMRVGTYATARKISEATGGAVSVMELFEPDAATPAPKVRVKK